MSSENHRLIAKPQWMNVLERKLATWVPIHPNIISSLKLFVITPILFFSFNGVGILPNSSSWIFFLFIFFCGLDYLDGLVAREFHLESSFGKIYDRVTDYPLLFLISWQCIEIIPLPLLGLKLSLDCILLIQFLLNQKSTENRIRTTISYFTLISLLFLSQNWGAPFITPGMVRALLIVNIAFSATIALYNARIFQLRFVADLLSCSNLLCGFISMYFAYWERLEISLLFLLLGSLFDGFDGAAARKWGGTRWGVYSDDIADGVNYGIAPGVALFFMIDGFQGIFIGFLYSFFTISRLVYFTLNKDNGDPNYFAGVPSTIGGLVVLCSLILFQDSPVLLGLLVGMACVLMVSFDAHYRHLGRAYASRKKRYLLGFPLYALTLVLGAFVWGIHTSIAMLLLVTIAYGFTPSFLHFKHILRSTSEK